MCKSQPTDDKLSLIGAWSGHVTHLKFWGSNHITGTAEQAEPKVVKFCKQAISILATGLHIINKRGVVMVT